MKKLLIVLLALTLILGGLFLYKGGHHALFLAEALEEWLEEDCADQTLHLQYQLPEKSGSLSLTAETFWTEYADDRILGLTASGCTAYLHDSILYMDTGRAYALPDPSTYSASVRRLAAGLLLHGRLTKSDGVYHITMDRPQLELSVSVTADPMIRTIQVDAVTPDQASLQATLTPTPSQPHPIPQPVLDAMVHARMEPPMPLTEPLNILLPALEELLPMEGDLTLGLECGILNLSETVLLRLTEENAELERKGVTVELPLPDGISHAEPAALALLLLRNGTFTREVDADRFRLELPPETTDQLCAALIPQVSDLGIRFGASEAVLTIRDNSLSSVTMTAEGEVPFLITTIPVAFRAELLVH